MKPKITIILVILVAMSATLACGLPFQALTAATSVPTMLPATATQPPTPTSLPTATRPVATATRAPANLSGAVLLLADLPAGFQELDQKAQAELGISAETLTAGFAGAFSEAKATGFKAFMNPSLDAFEVVVGVVVAPLLPNEQASFDQYLADPNQVAQDFGSGLGSSVEVLRDVKGVGEKTVGITFLNETGVLVLRGDVVLARRQSAIMAVMTLYQDGKKPPAAAPALANTLDARLKAAFEK